MEKKLKVTREPYRPGPQSAINLLGLYRSGGPSNSGSNSSCAWDIDVSYYATEVYDTSAAGHDKTLLFLVCEVPSSRVKHRPYFPFNEEEAFESDVDAVTPRGLKCIIHDVLNNGWVEMFPSLKEAPLLSSMVLQVWKVEIRDDDEGRGFYVYLYGLVQHKADIVMGIRYEKDWKGTVMKILKSNFQW